MNKSRSPKPSSHKHVAFWRPVIAIIFGLSLIAGAVHWRHNFRVKPAAKAPHNPVWGVHVAHAASVADPIPAHFPLRLLNQKPVFGAFDGSIEECDVLVVGGTPSGVAAALAAARRGANVVLIEERPHLGGDIVYQMLNMWDVPLRPGSSSPVVQGIFAEFFDQLGIAFDVDKAMHLFEESVAVEPTLHTFVETRVGRILKEGNRVTGAFLRGVDGKDYQIKAKTFIDATNDATFAARAGSAYFIGRQKTNPDRAMQSAGLLFSVSGVNWLKAKNYTKGTRLRPLVAAEVRRVKFAIDLKPVATSRGLMVKERLGGGVGNYLWERGNIVKRYQPQGPDIELLSINFGRQDDGTIVLNTLNILGVNGLSASSIASATKEAIAELPHFVAYLRKAMPGFEHAQISEIAPELYIRETRHIQGLFLLREQDIKAETRFPDRIALASYPLDSHPYLKGILNPLAPHRYDYTIPLGCLIPSRIDGVFVASRSLSATSAAAGSARVLPITMACGEAAGAAAWLCAQKNITPQTLAVDPNEVAQLQQNLRDWGADIGDKYPIRPTGRPKISAKLAAAMDKLNPALIKTPPPTEALKPAPAPIIVAPSVEGH